MSLHHAYPDLEEIAGPPAEEPAASAPAPAGGGSIGETATGTLQREADERRRSELAEAASAAQIASLSGEVSSLSGEVSTLTGTVADLAARPGEVVREVIEPAPEAAATSYPTPPAQAAAIAAGTPAGPGGVVPYTESAGGGFVRVGSAALPGGPAEHKAPTRRHH